MAKALDFRRRREALTDYKKRFALVKGGHDRVVVRKTNKRIIAEVVRYAEKGDLVLAYVDSGALATKYKWPSRSNRPTAYLTGIMLAKVAASKIKESNGKEYILDIGLSSPVKNSIPFVFAKGCIDGGMKLKAGLDMKEAIYNYSNTEYVKKAAESGGTVKQYGKFLKDGINLDSLGTLFEATKKKIMSE
jgi:large subunit ribosomal protein L18